MEENKLQKIIKNIKHKFKKEKKEDPEMNEYAFNTRELDELQKENKAKIKELKKEISENKQKEKVLDENELNNSILNQSQEEVEFKEEPQEEIPNNSYINLEKEYQDLIMNKWKAIDINDIDLDIIAGKDLLNHNYTITYADEASRFIQKMRIKYEVVLCYLIGFNNEKKGIYHQTTFTKQPEGEWKYLNYYIKLLEKIRNFKINE